MRRIRWAGTAGRQRPAGQCHCDPVPVPARFLVFFMAIASRRVSTPPAEIDRPDRGAEATFDSDVMSSQEGWFTTRGKPDDQGIGSTRDIRSVPADGGRPGGQARTGRRCSKRTAPRVRATDGRRPVSRMSGDERTGARFDLHMPLGGQGPAPVSPGPALLVGKGPRSLFSPDDPFSPAPTRFLARGGGPTRSRGMWPAPEPHSPPPWPMRPTRPCNSNARHPSGTILACRASRMPAHDDHPAAEAPEAVPPLLSSRDEESFPCGNS